MTVRYFYTVLEKWESFKFSMWISFLWNWNTSRTCYRWGIILCTALVMQLSLTWIKIIIPIHIFLIRIAWGKAVLLHRGFNYIIRFLYSKLGLVLIQNKSQKFPVTGIVQGFLIQRQSTERDWTWTAVSENSGISGLETISLLGCLSDTKLHSLVSSVKPTNKHIYEFSRNQGCLEDACQASFFCLISKITAIKLNSLWTFSCHSQVKGFLPEIFWSALITPLWLCRYYQCSTNKHRFVERGSWCWGPTSTLYRGVQGVLFGLAVVCLWTVFSLVWSPFVFCLIQKESRFWFTLWEPVWWIHS